MTSKDVPLGDATRGAAIFMENCASCHNLKPNEGHKRGPNLWGLWGRNAQSAPGFEYTESDERKGRLHGIVHTYVHKVFSLPLVHKGVNTSFQIVLFSETRLTDRVLQDNKKPRKNENHFYSLKMAVKSFDAKFENLLYRQVFFPPIKFGSLQESMNTFTLLKYL